jgi:hypothetical protein
MNIDVNIKSNSFNLKGIDVEYNSDTNEFAIKEIVTIKNEDDSNKIDSHYFDEESNKKLFSKARSKSIQKIVDKLIWQGNVNDSNPNLNKFNGFLTQALLSNITKKIKLKSNEIEEYLIGLSTEWINYNLYIFSSKKLNKKIFNNNDELNSTYIIQSVTGLSLNNNIIVTKDNNFIIEVDEMNDKSILNFNDKNECWEFLRVFKLNVEINSYSDIVVIECVD